MHNFLFYAFQFWSQAPNLVARYWTFEWCLKYGGVARLNVRKPWAWKQPKARLLSELHQYKGHLDLVSQTGYKIFRD